MKYKQVNIYPR